jgi:rhodanese-related sulfurtransferase
MKKIILILMTAVILAACQSKSVTGETVPAESGSYNNITSSELNTMLKDKDFIFINVHIPFAGNIAGTDVSIPYDQIEKNLSQLPLNKNAKIVLYCRSGRMSTIVAEKLVSLGYANVWNLEGGMMEWEQAGYELDK